MQGLEFCWALNLSVILQLLQNVNTHFIFTNSHIVEVWTSAEEKDLWQKSLELDSGTNGFPELWDAESWVFFRAISLDRP